MAGELDNPDLALAMINLAGNVAVFVPLGLCLRMALRGARRAVRSGARGPPGPSLGGGPAARMTGWSSRS